MGSFEVGYGQSSQWASRQLLILQPFNPACSRSSAPYANDLRGDSLCSVVSALTMDKGLSCPLFEVRVGETGEIEFRASGVEQTNRLKAEHLPKRPQKISSG